MAPVRGDAEPEELLSVGALAAALAGTPAVLIAARLLQGTGAALAYPPALSLTAESFPTEPWRGRAFAAGAVAGSTGTVAGAVFGGVVTGTLGWPWTFGLTVPPGLLLLALAARVLPATRPAEPPPGSLLRRLDLPGVGLAAAALTVLLLALTRGEAHGLADPLVPAGGAGAAVLTGLLVVQQPRAPAALLPAAMLRSRRLAGGCAGIAANSVLYSAVVFVGTLHLQRGAGFPPLEAGLAFLPVSATSLLAGALVITPVRRRLGSVPTAVAGLVLGLVALLLLAAAPARPVYLVHLLPAFLLIGVALTAAFVSFTEHTVGGAAPETRGVVSGVFETSPTSAARSGSPPSPSPSARPRRRAAIRSPTASPPASSPPVPSSRRSCYAGVTTERSVAGRLRALTPADERAERHDGACEVAVRPTTRRRSPTPGSWR